MFRILNLKVVGNILLHTYTGIYIYTHEHTNLLTLVLVLALLVLLLVSHQQYTKGLEHVVNYLGLILLMLLLIINTRRSSTAGAGTVLALESTHSPAPTTTTATILEWAENALQALQCQFQTRNDQFVLCQPLMHIRIQWWRPGCGVGRLVTGIGIGITVGRLGGGFLTQECAFIYLHNDKMDKMQWRKIIL